MGETLAGEVVRRVCLGELGRAAQLLGQAKVAAPTPETRDELQRLLVTTAQARGLLDLDPHAAAEVLARHLATIRPHMSATAAGSGGLMPPALLPPVPPPALPLPLPPLPLPLPSLPLPLPLPSLLLLLPSVSSPVSMSE